MPSLHREALPTRPARGPVHRCKARTVKDLRPLWELGGFPGAAEPPCQQLGLCLRLGEGLL